MRPSAAHRADPDVVVIGAGPSGLSAAAELARHGVAARVLERLPVPHHQTRATGFSRGHPSSSRTEQILAERLAQLGGVVERGVAFSSVEERDDGVLIRLEQADGTSTAVEAAWVIGAGGAPERRSARRAGHRVEAGAHRGRARAPALLESFEIERLAADRHVLDISGRIDGTVRAAVEGARTGRRTSRATPAQRAALARSRCLLDVSYAGSPVVGEHIGPGVEPPGPPGPGERFPDRTTLTGSAHHLLIPATADAAGVEHLDRRWRRLVDIVRGTGEPTASSGALLVRPDGHVGFRATPADAARLAALDAFLDSYLVPAPN